jgi:hypothetical protein
MIYYCLRTMGPPTPACGLWAHPPKKKIKPAAALLQLVGSAFVEITRRIEDKRSP